MEFIMVFLSFASGLWLCRTLAKMRIDDIIETFRNEKEIIFQLLDDDDVEFSIRSGKIKNITTHLSDELKRF